MKLSIVIPTLNEEAYIDKLIQSINEQIFKPFEIIVVDCGSTDATQEIVQKHEEITLIREDKPVGNQRDRGGRKACGDMLLFLDADVFLERNFIKASLAEMRQRQLTIACPRYIPYPGSFVIRGFYSFFNILFKISQNHKPSGAGSCIFVTKDVFLSTGGFDSKYVFDDIVFIRKASQRGSFGMLDTHIFVSDRRIRRYGLIPTVMTYFLLSICFLFGLYGLSNYLPYSFGLFHTKNMD